MKRFTGNKGFLRIVLMFGCSSCLAAYGRLQGQAIEPGTDAVQAIREIDDPGGEMRWLLLRDNLHPGGPGRLVAVRRAGDVETRATEAAVRPHLSVIIRGGERVILEQETQELRARFDAIALGPAKLGDGLNIRLRMNGKKMHVVAIGPGRVQPWPLAEDRP